MLLLILLAFPVAEVVLMVQLAARFGWGLLAYLVFAAVCGWMLIQDERWVALGRMAETLRGGDHPVRALLTSAKKVVAGILLILPFTRPVARRLLTKVVERRLVVAPAFGAGSGLGPGFGPGFGAGFGPGWGRGGCLSLRGAAARWRTSTRSRRRRRPR